MKALATFFGIALAYFLIGHAGLTLASGEGGSSSAIFPAAGVATACLILAGPRYWPAVWIGAFALNYFNFRHHLPLLSDHKTILAAAAIASGSTLQDALIACIALKIHLTGRGMNCGQRTVVAVCWTFVLCLIASTVGVSALVMFAGMPVKAIGNAWVTWTLGDYAGIVIFGIMIVDWLPLVRRWRVSIRPNNEATNALSAVFAVMIIGYVVFSALVPPNYSVAFFLLPPLGWMAFCFARRWVTLALALVTLVTVHGTIVGHGSFATQDTGARLIILQLYLVVIALNTLLISAVSTDRDEGMKLLKIQSAAFEYVAEDRANEIVELKRDALERELEQRELTHRIESTASYTVEIVEEIETMLEGKT